jgi:hypothetical protein
MQILQFRIPEDISSMHIERVAPGQRIDLAQAVNVIMERFFEEALTF